MTDIALPIADWTEVAGHWIFLALFAYGAVEAYLSIRSAYLAEASAAQQAAWTAHLPCCGLCGAHRLLTTTEITVLDDIGHRITDSHTVPVCSDCREAITSYTKENAA